MGELCHPALMSEYEGGRIRFGEELLLKVGRMVREREEKVFSLEVGDRTAYLGQLNKYVEESGEKALSDLLLERAGTVCEEIAGGALRMAERKQKGELKESREQEEVKEVKEGKEERSYDEFLKEDRRRKEERRKAREEEERREREQQAAKRKEEKEAEEKEAEEKRKELAKKIEQEEERRKSNKEERYKRDLSYREIARSKINNPPLFQRLEHSVRREEVQTTRPKEELLLDQHEKKYEELRSERDRQRQNRMKEQERLLELQEQQLMEKYRHQVRYSSQVLVSDEKEEAKLRGKEKQEKIKKYIEETVKERYLPKVDENKRKELLQAIENMSKRRMKKVVSENGVSYEEVKASDPRMLGLEYLEKVKEMTSKMKRKEKSEYEIPKLAESKAVDYLAQLRKRPRKSVTGMTKIKKLPFQERVKIVEIQTKRLEELAKQKEMQLKFGKFSTSEELLQQKEMIDQHYIDIVNLKLSLITE